MGYKNFGKMKNSKAILRIARGGLILGLEAVKELLSSRRRIMQSVARVYAR
jgi:hypothetical protein